MSRNLSKTNGAPAVGCSAGFGRYPFDAGDAYTLSGSAQARPGLIPGAPGHLARFQTSPLNGLSSPIPVWVYVSPSTLALNLNVFWMSPAVLSLAYSTVSA